MAGERLRRWWAYLWEFWRARRGSRARRTPAPETTLPGDPRRTSPEALRQLRRPWLYRLVGRQEIRPLELLAARQSRFQARRPAGSQVDEQVARLSRRQLEVARLALDGLTNRQIASQLGVSEETIKKHINVILRTLGIHSRRQLDRPDLRDRLRGPR